MKMKLTFFIVLCFCAFDVHSMPSHVRQKYIQEFVDLRDLYEQGQYKKVIDNVDKAFSYSDLNNAEFTHLHKLKGFSLYSIGDRASALKELRNASNYFENVDENTVFKINLAMDTLNALNKIPETSIAAEDEAENIANRALLSLRSGDQKAFLENISDAIDLRKSSGKKPDAIWLKSCIFVLKQRGEHSASLPVAVAFAENYPSIESYRFAFRLSASLKKSDLTIDLLKTAYDKNLEITLKEIRLLVGYYLKQELNKEAAKLVNDAITSQRMEFTEPNLRYAYSVFFNAGHSMADLSLIERAAALYSSDTKWQIRLSLAYEQLEMWPEVEELNEKMLTQVKGPTNIASLWLTIGKSRYYQNNKRGARKAFKQAKKSAKIKAESQAWLDKL